MSQHSDLKKQKISLIVTALILLSLFGIIIYFGWPFFSIFSNPDETRELIIEAGVWGPLIYILMQAAQVLIAPIPGQVIGLIGGFLFGPIWGLIYTLIGATIGFTLVFILTRKLGRPFVERFVSKKFLDKFDHLIKEKGVLVFFLIFLLPAFPDDIISFIAGLTTIKIPTLVIISLLGRLPGYIVLILMGNGLVEDLNFSVFTVVIILILSAIAWWKRRWIHEFVDHNNRILFIKEHWNASWGRILMWILGLVIISILLYQFIIVFPLLK